MLGEQLIKNEMIALVEIIKNSYDADADWAMINFDNFGPNLEKTAESKIIIEDNGEGMTLDVIENCWMNPATPNKLSKDQPKRTKNKQRVVQGEKGIGRFALLKIGSKIDIYTRPENSEEEYIIHFDFSKYDDDFLTESKIKKDLFIDDIVIKVDIQKPVKIIDRKIKINHERYNRGIKGTRIEISCLKTDWTNNKIDRVYNDVSKLESIFSKITQKEDKNKFLIGIYISNKERLLSDNTIEKLEYLFSEKAVLRITNGRFDDKEMEYTFTINETEKSVSFDDSLLKGMKFYDNILREIDKDKIVPTCGPFQFNFFIFDFEKNPPARLELQKDDRELLKKHRIYLYRDKIRVYPYGDPEDDWLKIDTLRGTSRAGHFFSNDQVVGWIEISKAYNPLLIDKTNREGLIEENDAVDTLIKLVQIFLTYIMQHYFNRYKADIKDKKSIDIFRTNQLEIEFDKIKEKLKDNLPALALVSHAYNSYIVERKYLVQRAETTEELAGVGLSVETASHDIMLMLSNGLSRLDDLILKIIHDDYDKEYLLDEIKNIKGTFSFLESQMKDIQLLFKSSKQRPHQIRFKEILEKVLKIYKGVLKRENILFDVEENGAPIVVKCTDAVILQLLINLFDNSIWWLNTIEVKQKRILVTLDGNSSRVIFSDNGPGVKPDDIPYIFEAFYSAKGAEGRGLGLYIARRLLERFDYSIELAEFSKDKVLSGANFIVWFISQEE